MQKNFSQNEKIFKISDQIIKFFISPEILGIKSLNFVRNIHKSRNEKVTFNILRRLSLFIYSQFFSFKKINNKKVDTIFLSHFTDVRLKSKVVDNYHGEISKKLKKNFFTLFINHTTINPFVVKRKLYKNQEILPHYLNFFDEIKIKFKVSLKFLKIFFQILFIKHINNKTKILSLIYSRANINSACNGIRIAMLVEKFIFFYNPSNLVITFEGHFYERCIIHILKKKFKNLRIIGNQFTIFRKNQHGLLRNLKLKNFNPDLIISKNFFFTDLFKKINAHIVVKNIGSKNLIKNKVKKIYLNEILMIPEGIHSEVDLFLQKAIEFARYFKSINFILRLHPLINEEIYLKKIPLELNNLKIQTFKSKINFNLPKIVIYSGSSLIIKLCEKSFFPVYLKINEDTFSDPLFQIKKPHISKPQQLENIIKKFRIKNNFYFDSHSKIIKYSTDYFYKTNKEKILKVFSQ